MATKDISAIYNHECAYCGRMFRSKWQLSDHVRRKHEEIKPYKCELCPKDFIKNSDLTKHTLSHSTETPFHCKFCDRSFKTKQGHKIHEDTHGFNSYPCPYCTECFKSYRKLYLHKKVHKISVIFSEDIANYECSYCYHTFSTYQNKRVHEINFHLNKLILTNNRKHPPKPKLNKNIIIPKLNTSPEQSLKIPVCKKRIFDSTHLTCPVCSEVLQERSLFMKHAQAMHPGDARPHVALILAKLTNFRLNKDKSIEETLSPDDSCS